jgi:chemotaxis protein MotB
MGRKRKGGDEGHGNAERWLLTYSDMITLLMAFFMMLYSMSILNLARFHEVAISIRSGFNGIQKGSGMSSLNSSGQFTIKPSPIDGLGGVLSRAEMSQAQRQIEKSDVKNYVKIRQDERVLVISLITDKVLFPKGQADLTPNASHILAKVCDIVKVKTLPNNIRVEGHTCNLPIRTLKFPTNWELSSSRASRVVRYLIEEQGIAPEHLSAAGYADRRPLPGVSNDTEANRAKNRRVDIVILKRGSL